jgi:hypothetical protein
MMERRGTPVVFFFFFFFFAILDFCVPAHYALENLQGLAESFCPFRGVKVSLVGRYIA